jgi:dUTP pyrophosphatase
MEQEKKLLNEDVAEDIDASELIKVFQEAFNFKNEIKFLKTHDNAELPKYQSDGASGFDFHTPEGFTIGSNETKIIDTGLKLLCMPEDREIQIRSRSGMAAKKSVIVLNTPGTIDSDYRGQIKIILRNFDNVEHRFEAGDRIAQGVLSPVLKSEISFGEIENEIKTDRGEGGLGSTDKK